MKESGAFDCKLRSPGIHLLDNVFTKVDSPRSTSTALRVLSLDASLTCADNVIDQKIYACMYALKVTHIRGGRQWP